MGNGAALGTLLQGMWLSDPKRAKHFTAMVLIGDGVMALIHPQHDAKAWKKGPKFWRDAMQAMHKRPTLTRVVGAVQVAAGIWWALKQEEAD